MPDLGSATFSQTDASNATGTQPSWNGSAAPSTLDDAGRALQGAITREWNWRSYTVTAGGTANAKTLTYSVAPAALYTGQKFAFIANTANSATCTLNINSLGAVTIKKDVAGVLTALSSGDMPAGQYVEVTYNGADFVWTNWQGPTDTVTLGANSFTAVQTIAIADAVTNTVTDTLKLAHSTSGTAAASFGAGLLYQLEDAAGTLTDAASVDAVWVDATNASEDSRISFKTMVGGVAKAEAAYVAQGMVIGSATSGDQGAGSINATAIYDDGVQVLPLVLGTPYTTTGGTSIDFTGIPSTARRVVISFSGVSTSGIDNILIQIGDSGGIENTGYNSYSCKMGGGSIASGTAYTTGFGITIASASAVLGGSVAINLLSSSANTWCANGFISDSNGSSGFPVGGSKSLTGTLDRVRVTTTSGADTFDAVLMNIMYE